MSVNCTAHSQQKQNNSNADASALNRGTARTYQLNKSQQQHSLSQAQRKYNTAQPRGKQNNRKSTPAYIIPCHNPRKKGKRA